MSLCPFAKTTTSWQKVLFSAVVICQPFSVCESAVTFCVGLSGHPVFLKRQKCVELTDEVQAKRLEG